MRMPPGADPDVVSVFVEESLESLTRMEEDLVLVHQGKPPADLVARLFRPLHTIKGTARFLEAAPIAELAHRAEDVLDGLRESGGPVTPEHATLLLEVLEVLQELIGTEAEVDTRALLTRLAAQAPAPEPEPVPAPAPAAPLAAPAPRPAEPASLRLKVAVLERLQGLSDELHAVRARLQRALGPVPESAQVVDALRALSRVGSALSEEVTRARLQPLAAVLHPAARVAQDVARRLDKPAQCTVGAGGELEVDRALLDALREPLLHIVRNAVDHGLEDAETRAHAAKEAAGQVTLSARHDGDALVVEVQDDGRGLDPARLREAAVRKGLFDMATASGLSEADVQALIFHPGFSTRQQVTETSGRGVGMDVVRTAVEALGGRVELDSSPGEGTCVRLVLPRGEGRVRALLVRHGGARYALPQRHVRQVLFLDPDTSARLRAGVLFPAAWEVRGQPLPLARLPRPDGPPPALPGSCVLVLQPEERPFALWVDDVEEVRDVVLRPLDLPAGEGPWEASGQLPDGTEALVVRTAALTPFALAPPPEAPLAEA